MDSEWWCELLASAGQVRARRMFGGLGLFDVHGMIALVVADRLYLKLDPAAVPAFAAAGSEPFRYRRQGKWVALGYWSAPDDALDDSESMRPWLRLARSGRSTGLTAG